MVWLGSFSSVQLTEYRQRFPVLFPLHTNLKKLSAFPLAYLIVWNPYPIVGLETVCFLLSLPSKNHNLHFGDSCSVSRCNSGMSLRFGSGWLVTYFSICPCTFIFSAPSCARDYTTFHLSPLARAALTIEVNRTARVPRKPLRGVRIPQRLQLHAGSLRSRLCLEQRGLNWTGDAEVTRRGDASEGEYLGGILQEKYRLGGPLTGSVIIVTSRRDPRPS